MQAKWRRDEVECMCTTANLSSSNSIKIVSDIKWLNGDLALINVTVQKHDRSK